jgi:transposase
MSHFIVTDRKTDYLLPPSLDDWLNQDHLARFIVEVVDQLDLSKDATYAGRGSKAYHPATLLAIWSMATPRVFSPAAGWSGQPTIR